MDAVQEQVDKYTNLNKQTEELKVKQGHRLSAT